MKVQKYVYNMALLPVILLLVMACNPRSPKPGIRDLNTLIADTLVEPEKAEEIAIAQLDSSQLISTCNECHADLPPQVRRKEITDLHRKLFTLLAQESRSDWCTNCHLINGNDSLNLAIGKSLTFSESHLICSQCHPEKLRQWEVGVHGKRLGAWGDEKIYMLRVPKNNPHPPKIRKVVPEPPPVRQEEISQSTILNQ